MELHAALESEDPHAHMLTLPVHQGGVDDAIGIADRAAVLQGEVQTDHDVVADGLHLRSCSTCCHQWYQAGFCISTQLYTLPGCNTHDVDRIGMQGECLVGPSVVSDD